MDVFGLGLLYINNWLFLFAAIVVVAYYYYTWNYGYWESRGITGPKPKFPMGTMTGHVRDMDVRNARKYGQVYGIYEGRRPVLMVQDPELLKCIFVKNHHDFPNRRNQKGDKLTNMMLPMAEGEQWKALRAAMSPTFSTGKLKLMFEQVTECAQDMADAMSKEANTGKSFDIKEYSGRYALDVISTTAYGLKIEAQQDKDNKFITMAQKIFDSFEFNIGYVISFFFPFLVPLLEALEVNFFAKDAQGFFKHVTQQTMEARRESGQKRTDFIQLMMNAHKEPNEQQEHDTEFNELYKGTTRRRLTKDEVLAQGMVFLPTAYDTTAASVSFLIYNLALNPEIQEKVHEEIDRVAGNESISNNMLSQMSLLDMCVQESLRIYIPGFRTDRVCSNETKIGDISIPKGMLVVVPIYAIHHDPKIWPEPEKFNPYRFTPEEKAKHGPYDWMPFGAGPRNCIAMRFALLEVKVAAAYLLQKYKFVRSVDTEVPVEVKNMLNVPKNGIWLEMEKRSVVYPGFS